MTKAKIFLSILFAFSAIQSAQAGTMLPGLDAPVKVVRDSNGIPHIYAKNEHDLFFMQGRIHAEDRMFQMDLLRRNASGTLAEVLGVDAIPTDVEIRTFGLGRAALRSLDAHPQEMIDNLQAYSDGVNSFLDEAESAGQLPPEYGALQLTTVKRWLPLDSVLVGKALGAATSLLATGDIDLTVALLTYQGIGDAAGFNGDALFFEDLFRSAPFDPASTVPDALNGFNTGAAKSKLQAKLEMYRNHARKKTLDHGRDYLKRIRKLRKLPGVMPLEGSNMGGSNSWVVGGQHTPTRRPLLANDMHLRLESPTIFHEVHLVAPGIRVNGSSLPGAPCVVRGHNQSIAWGITNSRLDITDIYSEVIVEDAASPSGLSTLHVDADGVPSQEPIDVDVEGFFYNNFAGGLDPADFPEYAWLPDGYRPVLTVPRRSNGPLITAPEFDAEVGALTALSVQSVGFGPTRDPEGICAINRAKNLDQFKDAIRLIDFASQNITYADKRGNIAYFVSGEVPLREDLQNPVSGVTPPFLIRNGFEGNNWVALAGTQAADQATPFAILPFDEMPQVVNPPSGIIVNANNDQVGNTLDNNPLNDLREGGNGLRYLNWGGRNFSIRAGRETEMINQLLSRYGKDFWRNKITIKDMKRIQADTVLNDAKALSPYILEAYDNAIGAAAHPALAAFGADPRLAEAVERLRNWNFTTPTGIGEGYDADPGAGGVDASVAATIYSVWRGKMVANSIDATLDYLGTLAGIPEVPRPEDREEVVTALKHLLEVDGVGVSGLTFFNVPGITDPALSRDIVVLKSLIDALDLLASDAFAPAFANSTNQDDYRWGRLHRIVFKNTLGGPFNVPPAIMYFPPTFPDLAGISFDGGFETVDEAPPMDASNIRVSDSDSMMVEFGPTGRFVARVGPGLVRAETSSPGGQSAVPGSPYYVNLLEPWFKNETFRMLVSPRAVRRNADSIQRYLPVAP